MRQIQPVLAVLLLTLLVLPGTVVGARNAQQSFETCSMITSEYLTILQLTGRGLSAETLSHTLPDISKQAQKRIDELSRAVDQQGLASVYSSINAEYARCAKSVYERTGIPHALSRESHFYTCAGENKVRYQVLMSAVVGAAKPDILSQLAPSQRDAGRTIIELYQSSGALTVFDKLADELKFCINNNL